MEYSVAIVRFLTPCCFVLVIIIGSLAWGSRATDRPWIPGPLPGCVIPRIFSPLDLAHGVSIR